MERIGEYLVRRLIGEGGMGKVFEAEERLSHRRVALKVLRPELSRSETGRSLFLNEMTILAHLDHPNVVRCLACTEVDGELVMALEYLEGPTLRQILADRGRLPWGEAVAIVGQVAAGLSAAHGQEPAIIHRDLKPENVVVLPDGTVKVMDFGIAKVLQALGSTTTHSVGTLQYMSPEQIDAGTIDGRSDLYALGLVFFEMLAGRTPFESASPRELLNMQCTAPAPPLPDDVRSALPRGVERLLYALLEKRPEDRPADAAAVVEALEPFVVADFRGVRAHDTRRPKAQGHEVSPVARSHPPATASRPLAHHPSPFPMGSDTIGLVERAAEPKRIATSLGVAIIVLSSLMAGAITYFERTSGPPALPVAPQTAAR